MALTISVPEKPFVGSKREVYATVTFDSSYATGGEAFSPTNVGLEEFLFVEVSFSAGYLFEYDYTNQKIKAYWSPSAAAHTHTIASHGHDISIKGGQAAAGTDVVSVKSSVLGKESATDATVAFADLATKGGVVGSGVLTSSSNGAFAAGAFAEVTNGTDLSSIATRVRCLGV